jgi:uncharacterized membrane protein
LPVTSPENREATAGLTTSRIGALSDSVFAVVFTLMVFQIRLPDLPASRPPGELARHLRALWPDFLSYVLSFVIAGVFWVGHHNIFHYVRRTDRVFLWLNLVFLMFIAFIPLSTALLGRYSHEQVAVVVYGVHLIIIGVLLYLVWSYATHRHRLVEPEIDPNFVRRVKVRILLSPAACVVAIGASFVNVRWSMLLYLLVLAFYIVPGRIDRLWSRR